MRKIFVYLMTAMVSLPLYSQNIEDQKVYWKDGPLTLDMFQTRHTRESDKPVSFLEWEIHNTDTVVRSGNTRFISHKMDLYMYKSLSWFDPDKSPDWSLRYNQAEFDLIEVLRRQCQNALNSDSVSFETNSYYRKLLNTTTETFDVETDYGKDTAAIARYEEQIRRQLETVKENPPRNTLPLLVPQSQIGLSLMYDFEYYFEPVSVAYKPLNGVQALVYLNYGRFKSDISYTWSWCGGLKTDNFYYDADKQYQWRKGETGRSDKFLIKVGYDVVDTKYISVAPMVGVGTTTLIQNTGQKNEKGDIINSSIGACNRLTAGLSFGFKYRRVYNNWNLTENMVRLNVLAARSDFKEFGPAWSLNVGVTVESRYWKRK